MNEWEVEVAERKAASIVFNILYISDGTTLQLTNIHKVPLGHLVKLFYNYILCIAVTLLSVYF